MRKHPFSRHAAITSEWTERLGVGWWCGTMQISIPNKYTKLSVWLHASTRDSECLFALTIKALKYFGINYKDQSVFLIWNHHTCLSQLFPLNPLTTKLFDHNFHSLEVVSRWRDPQLQVSENYSDLTKWRSSVFKYCWLMSHFIFVTCLKGGT